MAIKRTVLLSKSLAALAIAAAGLSARDANAVILYGSPTRNLTAPTGALANSGWQYQASLDVFLATPIAPNYFITAQHLGAGVGTQVVYNSVTYTSIQATNVPGTDLQVHRISGTFPSYAPLYNASVDGSEVGKQMVVFGKGIPRGSEVYVPGTTSQFNVNEPGLRGWQWSTNGPDNQKSWGENVVTGVVDYGAPYGTFLYFDFNADGGANEGGLAAYDSGGGVFIQSGGVWKLAGINYAVDGPWRLNPGDPSFNASIFDYGGLYLDTGGGNSQYLPDQAVDLPGASYSSSISANLSAILAITGPIPGIPEPSSMLAGAACVLLLGKRTRRR